jgi:hypothetical protein
MRLGLGEGALTLACPEKPGRRIDPNFDLTIQEFPHELRGLMRLRSEQA